jgi:exocyst complex component 4
MNKSELHQRERDAEVRLTGDRPIEKEDLIGPMRNVSALCNLYRSVVCLYILYIPLNAYDATKSWFTTGLKQLKAVPEDSLSPTSGLPMEPTSAMNPFTPALSSLMPLNPDEQLQLPLSREMAL